MHTKKGASVLLNVISCFFVTCWILKLTHLELVIMLTTTLEMIVLILINVLKSQP